MKAVVLWFCLSKGVSVAHNSQSSTPLAHTLDQSPEAAEAEAVGYSCSVAEMIVSVAGILDKDAGKYEVGVAMGAGEPALCIPSCNSHWMISCDGNKQEDDDNDDDDDDDDNNDDDDEDLGMIECVPVPSPVFDPTLDLAQRTLSREGGSDTGTVVGG